MYILAGKGYIFDSLMITIDLVYIYINKLASSNRCLTSSNKKLVVTSASLLVTGALLVVTGS